jgi:maleate isomerase
LLPPTLQVHVGRIPLLNSGAEAKSRSGDADVDIRARLLGHAKVEVVCLAPTAASLADDDHDETITQRMREAALVPATTSARAIGLAVRALGARRITLVTPYALPVIEWAKHHYADKYGLEVVAIDGFSGTGSAAFAELGPEHAREAIARVDRPEIEVLVMPGGNFPSMAFVPEWEREFGKPVITTNQAALWAMLRMMRADLKITGPGRLLEAMPAN